MASGPSANSPSLLSKPRFGLIFTGPHGIRAGWQLLLFFLIFAVVDVMPILLLRRLVPSLRGWVESPLVGTLNPGILTFVESWNVLVLFLAVFIMSKIERRPFSRYGLPGPAAFRRKFWFGAIFGLGGVLFQMALIATLGGYSLGAFALRAGEALKYALLWAVAFLFAAIFEEFSFRGYLQATLGSGIGFWPAAIVLSLGFAVLHLGNPGERWPGISMLFCFGMLAAFTLRLTGDLWFIIGLHATWDWAHIFLFSVPIAGMRGTQQLLVSSLHGPQWLTGGTVGPDGSVFALVSVLFIAALLHRVFSGGKANSGIRTPST